MVLRLVNRKKQTKFFISNTVHPQTYEVTATRAKYFGVEILTGNPAEFDFGQEGMAG